MRPKRADHIDRVVGQRVRARRIEHGLSQSALAEAGGISFQQIQKYEKGSNRISVGRLVQIASALGTTPAKLLAEPFVELQPAPRRKAA